MTREQAPGRKGDGAQADLFFAIVPERLLYSAVSDGALRLWAVLHRHADRGGQSWPSRATLATRLGCSVATVDRRVLELTEAGWLVVERRYDQSGDPTSNLYKLIVGGPTSEGTVVAPTGGPGSPISDDQTRAIKERESVNDPPGDAEASAGSDGVTGSRANAKDGPSSDAWAVARAVMAARKPPPVEGVKRVAELAQRFLNAGRSATELGAAMTTAATVSQKSVEIELGRVRGREPRNAQAGRWTEEQRSGPVREGVWTDD